jgi:probable rRNA maturation factor
MPIGSIIISADKVKQKADELGHSKEDEFKLLLIHGLLHLTGYDHETDNGEMREKEEEIIKNFNLPKSLIIRNSD